MKKIKLLQKSLAVVLFITLLSSCSTFKISNESLFLQLNKNQDISIKTHYSSISVTEYS